MDGKMVEEVKAAVLDWKKKKSKGLGCINLDGGKFTTDTYA